MSCQIFRHRQVIVVLWGSPQTSDLDACEMAVREVSEQGKKPVTFVAVIPPDAPVPDDDMKKQITTRFKGVLAYCESFHQILMGQGFFLAAKRAVFAAIVLLGSERKKVHVHSTLSGVLPKCPPHSRRDVGLAIKLFSESGRQLSA